MSKRAIIAELRRNALGERECFFWRLSFPAFAATRKFIPPVDVFNGPNEVNRMMMLFIAEALKNEQSN